MAFAMAYCHTPRALRLFICLRNLGREEGMDVAGQRPVASNINVHIIYHTTYITTKVCVRVPVQVLVGVEASIILHIRISEQ